MMALNEVRGSPKFMNIWTTFHHIQFSPQMSMSSHCSLERPLNLIKRKFFLFLQCNNSPPFNLQPMTMSRTTQIQSTTGGDCILNDIACFLCDITFRGSSDWLVHWGVPASWLVKYCKTFVLRMSDSASLEYPSFKTCSYEHTECVIRCVCGFFIYNCVTDCVELAMVRWWGCL